MQSRRSKTPDFLEMRSKSNPQRMMIERLVEYSGISDGEA